MTAYHEWRRSFVLLPDLDKAQKEACEGAATAAWRESSGLTHEERLAASRRAYGRERARLQGSETCSPLAPSCLEVGVDACGAGWPIDNKPSGEARCT